MLPRHGIHQRLRFTFLAAAPYLLSELLHEPPSTYGLMILLPMAGYILDNTGVVRLSVVLGSVRLFILGLALSLASGVMLALWCLGDLTPWAEHGVLLLNRVLTVEPGKPRSHQGKGWEAVTEQAIRALAGRGGPLVAILWGRDARDLAPLLGSVPRIESVHPSPMSAHNGFFGTRPFSRANQLLERQGAAPVDWKLP